MNARIVSQIGMVLLVSAIAVLAFSIYRSSHGVPSTGLPSLGTVLMVLGVALRVRARKAGQ
jgi:branched-subunit amino acid transport protein AzlD